MRRSLALILVVLAAAGGGMAVAGCGSKSKVVTDNGQVRTVPDIHFAKTKFLLHAGLAFGAFHRWIYNPYRAHAFSAGAPHRGRTIAKAAAAGAFAYHEIKVARDDALASDTLRRHLVEPLDRLVARFQSLPALVKAGSVAGIGGIQSLVQSVRSSGRSAGVDINDRSAPIPGG